MLALAAAMERPDKLEIVLIDERALKAEGIATLDKPGETPVPSLRAQHVDVEKLDYARLGKVARFVVASLHNDAYLRVTRNEVVELLVEAIRGNLVVAASLKGEMRVQVEQQLAK